jgi:hypothetical protein
VCDKLKSAMFDVFLSHDWGTLLNLLLPKEKKYHNHEKVKILNQIFQDSLGFVTWLDEEKLNGNIRDEITHGIENSNCMLIFLTKNYHEKVNSMNPQDYCYFEVNFAAHSLTNKRMIPVVMEEEMRDTRLWRGRLAAELGQHKYIDLVDAFNQFNENGVNHRSLLEEKCKQISEEIRRITIDYPKTITTIPNSSFALSSLSPSSSMNPSFRYQSIFLSPLSYEAEDLSNQFIDLRRELIKIPSLNDELVKIDYYSFVVSLLGFPDCKPFRCFLQMLFAVNHEVLLQVLEALLSFFFIIQRDPQDQQQQQQEEPLEHEEETEEIEENIGIAALQGAMQENNKNDDINSNTDDKETANTKEKEKEEEDDDEESTESIGMYVTPCYDQYQKRILHCLTECEGIKIFIQLYSKSFCKDFKKKEKKEKDLILLTRLLIIFRVLKNYHKSNYSYLQSMFLYDNIVSTFQSYYKLPLVELAGLFEVGHLKEVFSLKDLIEIGFSYKLLMKHYSLKEFMELHIPLSSLSQFFSLKELKKYYSFEEFLNNKTAAYKLKALAREFPLDAFFQEKKKKFSLKELILAFGKKTVYDYCIIHKDIVVARYSFEEFYKEFPLESLIDLGFSIKSMKEHGIDITTVISTLKKKNICSPITLSQAGYSLQELKPFYSSYELIACSFSVLEFKQADIPMEELVHIFSLKELYDAGYNLQSLISTNATFRINILTSDIPVSDFVKEGFPAWQLRNYYKFPIKTLLDGGCSLRSILGEHTHLASQFLIDCKQCGVSIKDLKENQFCSIPQLLSANYTVFELFEGGFSLHTISTEGGNIILKKGFVFPFSKLEEFKQQGESLTELSHFFSLTDLKKVGYSLRDLLSSIPRYSLKCYKDAGFVFHDFLDADVKMESLLKANIFNAKELLEGGCSLRSQFVSKNMSGQFFYDCKSLRISAESFKNEKFRLKELKGYFSNKELVEGGYSIRELVDLYGKLHDVSGVPLKYWLEEKYDLKELFLNNLFTIRQLVEGGISLKECSEKIPAHSRCQPREDLLYFKSKEESLSFLWNFFPFEDLTNVGYTLAELKANTPFKVNAYKALGFSLEDIVEAGFSKKEISSCFSADQLKRINFKISNDGKEEDNDIV